MKLTNEQRQALAEFKDLVGQEVLNLDATDFRNIQYVPTVKVETKENGRE